MNIFELFNKKPPLSPCVLIIIDGFGIAPPSDANPISLAHTPNLTYYATHYPFGQLLASGESVGLPAGSPGNSEVGHLTLGSGRVIYQTVTKINKSIENGSFFETKAFSEAIEHTKKNHSHLHLVGLAGQGVVHSDLNHLKALINLCHQKSISEVRLHLFTDGRDAPPQSAVESLSEISELASRLYVGKITTVAGRFYGMDRDARWERIKLVYDAIVSGQGDHTNDLMKLFEKAYANKQTDEFIKPTILDSDVPYQGVEDGDAVIFFNFRADRARQLAMSIALENFESIDQSQYGLDARGSNNTFIRSRIAKDLYLVSMTNYHPLLSLNGIGFPQDDIKNTLSEVCTKHNIAHAHIAESEKERMVTYYFNGFKDVVSPLSLTSIIPSPSVPHYDSRPEMSLPTIVKTFSSLLGKNKYALFVMNFANPDMVAHSGNKKATIKAVEEVDRAIKKVVDDTLARNGTVIITADHGNAEEIKSFDLSNFFYTTETGDTNTQHSTNPVPLYIIGKKFHGASFSPTGGLADVAPTILALLNIEKPQEMGGKNLLAEFNI